MNYQQLRIKPLPPTLKSIIIDYAYKQLLNNVPFIVSYGSFETVNQDSIAYTQSESAWVSQHGAWSPVSFYVIPTEISSQLIEFYKDIVHPFFTNRNWSIQVIHSAVHVPPHVDDSIQRSNGLLYLLEAGGSDVITSWYNLKDKYVNQTVPINSAIPYEKLNEIESHCFKEDFWHQLNFNTIHGVKNLQGTRLALNFAP
jgi:hypothetical protein